MSQRNFRVISKDRNGNYTTIKGEFRGNDVGEHRNCLIRFYDNKGNLESLDDALTVDEYGATHRYGDEKPSLPYISRIQTYG